MINAIPGATFEAVVQGFPTGLAGTVGVQVLDNVGGTSIARTTAGITERPASSGIYTVTLTAPSVAGQYTVVWDDGTISPSTTATEDLVVTYTPGTTPTGPLYVTAAQLKGTLSITGTSYADSDIDAALYAACRAIDNLCDRRFYADTDALQVRYYSSASPSLLEIDDLAVLTSLATDPGGDGTYENVWTLNTDFVLEPINAQADSQRLWPWTHLRVHPSGSFTFPTWYPRTVKLTGQFGWAAVPNEVVSATTLLANRILTISRSAPLGIVPFEGGAVRIARSDPQVMGLIGPLMRHRIAIG